MNNVTRAKRLLRKLPEARTHGQALLDAGYAPETARTQPERTINNAIALVEKKALQGDKTAQTALEAVGISKEEIIATLRYLTLESKNDNVRLAAVKPFARDIGVNYDEEKEKITPPAINIGIVNTEQRLNKAVDDEPIPSVS